MTTRKANKVPADADALRMLESWTHDDSAMQAMLAEERSNAAVGRQIHELRTARGLTQKQLADLIGTKQPVIARLEDADYQGHSLAMLYRIAAALGCLVAVRFVAGSSALRRKSQQATEPSPEQRTPASLDELEHRRLERTLRRQGGNLTRAAKELGISRATLRNKLRRPAEV